MIMKFDRIMETSQNRTKTHLEDIIIDETKVIKDNAEIPLDEIVLFKDVDNDEQPFNIDESEMTALEESIKELGQLTPATVRLLDNGKYELLSGHKRYIAMSRLGAKTLLCRVCSFTDKEAFKAVCHGNIQRKGEKPTELCRMYNGYRKRFGEEESVSEISKYFGVSSKTLYRCTHINHLVDELKPYIDNNLLSMHAVELVDKLIPAQQRVIADYITQSGKAISAAKAKKLITLATQNPDFTVRDVDLFLSSASDKNKQFKNDLYNTVLSSNPSVAKMNEAELDKLVITLLDNYFREKQSDSSRSGSVSSISKLWDEKTYIKEIYEVLSADEFKKFDIMAYVDNSENLGDVVLAVREQFKETGFSDPNASFEYWGTPLGLEIILKNKTGASIKLTWKQVTDVLTDLAVN